MQSMIILIKLLAKDGRNIFYIDYWLWEIHTSYDKQIHSINNLWNNTTYANTKVNLSD